MEFSDKEGEEQASMMLDVEDGITSSKWLLNWHCDFPLFTDTANITYNIYAEKTVNPIIFGPSVLVHIALLIFRCGLLGFGGMYFNQDSTYIVGLRLGAIVVTFFNLFIFTLYIAVHYLRSTGRDDMSSVLMTRVIQRFPLRLEEMILFTGCVVWSLFLMARMLKGPCAIGTTIWQQQTCNPFANDGGIPTELIYSLYMIPLSGQLVLKCISIRVLTASYLVCIAAVAFCVFYSQSTDYFVLINVLFFMNASFEIKRLQRVNYVEMLIVKKHQKRTIAQLNHEQSMREVMTTQELLLHRAEDEKRLKEVEAVQLRSLMGNVAHDLKTPLFAIEADIDTLKLHHSFVHEDAIRDATIRLRERTNKDDDDEDIEPLAIFESLWATIRFMVAAINRGQDYMKASNNVALVPTNGTFEFTNTLSMAHRCIRSTIPKGRHNLLCLTSNAIKYSDSGDIDLIVTLEPTQPSVTGTIHNAHHKDIIVTIEDHGVGVSEEIRETLFQPFRQAQRMAGGTGLGLYSLFKRVEALGGDCGVKGRRDGAPGSAFWFSFPYRPDPTAVVPSSLISQSSPRMSNRALHQSTRDFPIQVVALKSKCNISPSASQKTNDGTLRVLLTDDAPTILKVCKRMLQTNGHTVLTAGNGHQSLEKLKTYYTNNECDVLLTDLQMPVMDGIECTKRFRVWEEEQQCLLDAQGLPRRPRFLVVGMSANSDAQSKQEALEAGMDCFCGKPFNYDEFAAIISTHPNRFITTSN